mgnify:CR=1 FL=1
MHVGDYVYFKKSDGTYIKARLKDIKNNENSDYFILIG